MVYFSLLHEVFQDVVFQVPPLHACSCYIATPNHGLHVRVGLPWLTGRGEWSDLVNYFNWI
jgi:hypothetical protein